MTEAPERIWLDTSDDVSECWTANEFAASGRDTEYVRADLPAAVTVTPFVETTQPDPVKDAARPDVWAQSLCRELRQQGYLVPYPVMMRAIQNAASAEQEQSE